MSSKHLCGQFYGRIIRSCAIATLTLSETTYPLGNKLPRHSHDHAYFCFVLQGRFTEFYDKRSRTCQPATLIFHPPGEAHSDQFQTEARCFNIQFDAHLNHGAAGLEQPADFHGGVPTYLATKLYREFCEMDEVSALAIEGLVLEMIAESARAVKRSKGTSPTWLERARDLLHARFDEHLTLADLAGEVGVHPTHLARQFHRRYNRTVGEYVRQLRVEFACIQLCTSTAPLSEIAVGAGFFDQSHFARTFRLRMGISPARYRAAYRRR
ncbi:MAG: helix-turn-helix domain-containing protein [Pyrinomonadaceae bacterium]